MSEAKKCDRCGKFYTKNNSEHRSAHDAPLYKVEFIQDLHPDNNRVYDLCDDCMDVLVAFLNTNNLIIDTWPKIGCIMFCDNYKECEHAVDAYFRNTGIHISIPGVSCNNTKLNLCIENAKKESDKNEC